MFGPMSLQPPLHLQHLGWVAFPQTSLFALLIGWTETLVMMVYQLLFGLPNYVAQILHYKPVLLVQLDPASLVLPHLVRIQLC